MRRLPLPALAAALLLAGCGGTHAPRDSSPHRAVRHVAAPRPVARLPYAQRAGTIRLPILMYHRIDRVGSALPAITRRLTVDPREFARQLDWLAAHGYHTVTDRQVYDALERGAALPRRPVLITFDDGYRDVLGEAAPILRRLHMHATAFVITGRVSGPDRSFLTWPQVRRLERDGFDIGSHSVTHRDLTTLPPAALRSELAASARALERHLRHPVQWLAYPFGAFDAQVERDARAAGYVLGLTTLGGTVQDAAHPLELRRVEVQATTPVGGLVG